MKTILLAINIKMEKRNKEIVDFINKTIRKNIELEWSGDNLTIKCKDIILATNKFPINDRK